MRVALMAVVIVGSGLSVACAPAMLPQRGGMGIGQLPPSDPGRSAVGRWDAVMALEARSVVGVLAADGTRHRGWYVGAGLDSIRIHEAGSEVAIARREVARVDLLRGPGPRIDGRRVLGGAVSMALVMAATEMLTTSSLSDRVMAPNGRTLALGAASGAVAGAAGSAYERRARTVYVSPRAFGSP